MFDSEELPLIYQQEDFAQTMCSLIERGLSGSEMTAELNRKYKRCKPVTVNIVTNWLTASWFWKTLNGVFLYEDTKRLWNLCRARSPKNATGLKRTLDELLLKKEPRQDTLVARPRY